MERERREEGKSEVEGYGIGKYGKGRKDIER